MGVVTGIRLLMVMTMENDFDDLRRERPWVPFLGMLLLGMPKLGKPTLGVMPMLRVVTVVVMSLSIPSLGMIMGDVVSRSQMQAEGGHGEARE